MAHERDSNIILLVEDTDSDAALVSSAFDRAGIANPIHRVADGEQAVSYLQGIGTYADRKQHPLPAVILLDLNMPRFNGYQVMLWLRTQTELKRIPVVVLTESKDSESINRAYDAGANSYLVKPGEPGEIQRVVEILAEYWMSLNETPRLAFRSGSQR